MTEERTLPEGQEAAQEASAPEAPDVEVPEAGSAAPRTSEEPAPGEPATALAEAEVAASEAETEAALVETEEETAEAEEDMAEAALAEAGEEAA
ncbi:MAG: 30S ribosomal protein S16, partial [Anaerolineae bacterium]|nr:30S ribosomal protein S16 [Anaerolineae bacterium]